MKILEFTNLIKLQKELTDRNNEAVSKAVSLMSEDLKVLLDYIVLQNGYFSFEISKCDDFQKIKINKVQRVRFYDDDADSRKYSIVNTRICAICYYRNTEKLFVSKSTNKTFHPLICF